MPGRGAARGEALLIVETIAEFGRGRNRRRKPLPLYTPWAWLNGRYGFDLAPAQLQTFHNPLVDLPLHAHR